MQDEALEILKEIKESLSIVLGTNKLPVEKQFSMEALDKASKEFKKLRKENDQWVMSYDIHKYIKSAPYNNVGNFIRDEFQFTNTYLKGKSVYFYKKNLINLSKELESRNIDLARYMELKSERERIEKTPVDKYALRKQKKIQTGRYRIPQGLKDISAKQKIKKPLPELDKIAKCLTNVLKFSNLNTSMLQYSLTVFYASI